MILLFAKIKNKGGKEDGDERVESGITRQHLTGAVQRAAKTAGLISREMLGVGDPE